jgi:hypothetical protein
MGPVLFLSAKRRPMSKVMIFKSIDLIAEELSEATHLFARGAQDTPHGAVTWADF